MKKRSEADRVHRAHSAGRALFALGALAFVAVTFLSSSCRKVGLTDVGAGFSISDATWFESEQTLFFFYEVSTEQGLNDTSTLEVSYRSDDGDLAWAELAKLPSVHVHRKVECGRLALCGSGSLRVKRRPREIGMRLRYHRDGETALEVPSSTSYVDAGEPWIARSYLAYGVFDARNEFVQWRGRHNFPMVSNLEAERLGLVRTLEIKEQRAGTLPVISDAANPFLYGAGLDCTGFAPLGEAPLAASARAKWNTAKVPQAQRDASVVCARATTQGANGAFTANAFARRNADTGVALDALASPITENKALKFVARPCAKTISDTHLGMQKQRLLVEDDGTEVCLDGLDSQGAARELADAFSRELNEERAAGKDMVVSLAYHHDEESSAQWRSGIQIALAKVLTAEKAKSSPRLTGAFVFDSDGETTLGEDLKRLVLWCPAKKPPRLKGKPIPPKDESQKACEVQPSLGTLAKLGPLSIAAIPIFPTRPQYLDYVKDYGAAQAGKMRALTFLAPSHTPATDVVALGEFAQATFRDNETVQATREQGFSYCGTGEKTDPFVFRSSPTAIPQRLSELAVVHATEPSPSYEIGLQWEFPFLTRLRYEAVLAGSASAFGASFPFGIRNSTSEYYGESDWLKARHSLANVIVQCRRFCTHPPFDSAGVYNARLSWKSFHANVCDRSLRPVAAPGREESPYDP